MAKRKKKITGVSSESIDSIATFPVDETTSLPKDNSSSDTKVLDIEETVREQILDFKAKGWDANRIAARLSIAKHIVENA